MILLYVILIPLIPILYWYYILYKNRNFDRIPGPKPVMYLGSVLVNDPYDFYDDLLNLHKQYGPTVRIYTGPYVNILMSKPEHVQKILASSDNLDKSFAYDLMQPWLGQGLLLAKTAKWKGRRKILTPSFHFKILEEFMSVFNSTADILVEKLSEEVGKGSVDLFPFINLFSLDIICETAMGVKINAQTTRDNEYATTIKHLLEIIAWRFFSGWASFGLLFWMFANKLFKIHNEYIQKLHKFTNNVIQQKRTEIKEHNKNNKKKEEECFEKPKKALLDFLLTCEESNTLSDEDIREEIDTFMFGGQDTTTSALSLTLLELSRNPEVQEKLYEEIRLKTKNNSSEELTTSVLHEMKYLEMVIKEGLRKRPPVTMIIRLIGKECDIDGIKYPKGSIVALHINQMHNDPELYPDPEKFDPQRFSLENQTKRHPYAYIPFAAGPRNCIGHKFATAQMKVTITKIIKNFEILPSPGFKERLGFTGIIKSKNGACVRLKKRS